MSTDELESLRQEIERTNIELLRLLNHRGHLVSRVQRAKEQMGVPLFLPEREQQMLQALLSRNEGPFSDQTVRRLFKEIFSASVQLMESRQQDELRISRARRRDGWSICPGGRPLGATPVVVAGPCAVESEAQMDAVGRLLCELGLRFIRGGAFKPRSSPYSFQGLGLHGLQILRETARRYDLLVVTEVMDTRAVELVAEHADVLQVGARNMYNYDLLREVGRAGRPVLLKRGLSATTDELLWSAEYIALEGNDSIILCERGIRTFGQETRNTLDISAIPLLQQRTYLPVWVDVSHAAGRRDILAPLARAALAAGAGGVMVEVHPSPAVARSDSQQQLDFEAFRRFLSEAGLAAVPLPGRVAEAV